MDVDYDTYADRRSRTGLAQQQPDASSAAKPFDSTSCCSTSSPACKPRWPQIDAETAHLKAIGMAEGLYGVANLVSSFSPPELSLPSQGPGPRSRAGRQRPRRHRPRNADRARRAGRPRRLRGSRRAARLPADAIASAPAAPCRRIGSCSRRRQPKAVVSSAAIIRWMYRHPAEDHI